MSNRKYKWTEDVKVDCDPENDCNRRYILKIFPKDEAIIKNEILVIMCNPSTADKSWSDPTCNKLIRLCKSNGYNSITICNLFTFRGKIEELNEAIEKNKANDKSSDKKLEKQIKKFNEILCAWGKMNKIKDRNTYIRRIKKLYQKMVNKKLKEFGHSHLNGKDYPYHPRYPKEKSKIMDHKRWVDLE